MASIPRWKTALDNALTKDGKSVVIQLATILDNTTTANTPIPQVRSLVYRTSVTPSSNPSLPLLVATTDIRTPKVTQIHGNPNVQFAWWIEGTQEQYRITGRAHLIPSPNFGSSPSPNSKLPLLPLSANVDANAECGMSQLSKENYDWEHLRLTTFNSLSGHMKATFCRPIPPGSPFPPNSNPEEEAKKWPVKIEEPSKDIPADHPDRKNWDMAVRNFALLVVDPVEVDYVELGVVPNRRTVFRWDKEGGWSEEAVVP